MPEQTKICKSPLARCCLDGVTGGCNPTNSKKYKSRGEDLKCVTQNITPHIDDIPPAHKLPLREVLTDDFMEDHTDWRSHVVFFDETGMQWSTHQEFERLTQSSIIDDHVDQHSDFGSWRELEDNATLSWMEQQIDHGEIPREWKWYDRQKQLRKLDFRLKHYGPPRTW